MPAVQLIVGLGNPGPRYERTRHNAGFWFVDELVRRQACSLRNEARFHGDAARCSIDGHDCRLLKPHTFMNRSGQAVAALARFYRIPPEAILVVHDEIDLPPGTARLKRGGGHGGHNGLRDIIARLGSREFLRLRLGVGHPGHRDQVVDYVLHRPPVEEQTAIESAMDEALAVLPLVVAGELEQAMHRLHSP
ncbi:MAG TPA: aminoacyl-tRNA hydrolase [Thiotrichales bacterium]|nr:aminoacyl-tRNA hydrolase [Thiotrichales bacterium]